MQWALLAGHGAYELEVVGVEASTDHLRVEGEELDVCIVGSYAQLPFRPTPNASGGTSAPTRGYGATPTDPGWAEWGRRANTEVGVNTVLSQRLRLQEQDEVVAGLNIYSDAPGAFDRAAVGFALILANHGAMVL
jgi:hypothetical protein